MMKINIFFILIIAISPIISIAQNYFQQEVNYEIHVTLNDQKHELHGNISVEYTNNSPDNLEYIYFHLWPNAYKNSNTAFAKQNIEIEELSFHFSDYSERGFIDSLNFSANGNQLKWEFDIDHIDICKVYFEKPVITKETVTIETPFHVKLPNVEFSRLGHYDQTYNITQWYPKPAVYDKYGWHPMPYLEQGEFYSEFGSFDVYITLPENYVVAATGNLNNKEEIEWLKQKVEETKIAVKENSFSNQIPVSSKNFKTLHFSEKNIHDFAWCAGKQYYVLSEIILAGFGTIDTWIYFTHKEADIWQDALEYIHDALYYYSLWIGEYPYSNCSAIYSEFGAGGMEYPTITIISPLGNAELLELVIMHEVGHNWFYGTLGTNERKFPFLDEGLNSAYEQRYIETKYPDFKIYSIFLNEKLANFFGIRELNYSDINYYGYLTTARKNTDQPINISSEEYTMINYITTVYQKSAITFNYLRAYLGDSLFDAAMQDFYRTWKFKHPYPEDFETSFCKHTDKDLSWFFKDMISTSKKIDYKICNIKSDSCLLKNSGEINSPLNISGIKNNKQVFNFWIDGFNEKKWIGLPSTDVDKLIIDPEKVVPEIRRNNNSYKLKGVLKKTEPFKLQLAGLIENPHNTQLNYFPVLGFNYSDKLMPGLLLYNNLWPQKDFEFQILPLYSIGANKLVGSGNIQYNFYPFTNIFESAEISLSGMRYSSKSLSRNYFYKLSLEAHFIVNQKTKRSPYQNSFTIYASSISSDLLYNLRYNLFYDQKVRSISVNTNFQANKNFVKTWIEAKSIFFYNLNKSIELRIFAGKFLYQANHSYGNYNFRLSGFTGENDYLYNNYFIGREENITVSEDSKILSRQFTEADGGFAIFSLSQSNEWMASINALFELPVLPLHFYFSLATFDEILVYSNNTVSCFYESGFRLSIMDNMVNIYFPFKYSSTFDEKAKIYGVFNNYFHKIRFSLNIEKLNPFKLAKDFVYY